MNQSQTKRPILLGALIAPLGAPAALLLYTFVPALVHKGPAGLRDWRIAALICVFFGLPIAYGVMLVFGLPYITWLRRTARLTRLTICAGAIAAGSMALPGSLLLLTHGSQPYLANMAAGGFIGFVCGAIFCVVTGPNNSFKPKPLRGSA